MKLQLLILVTIISFLNGSFAAPVMDLNAESVTAALAAGVNPLGPIPKDYRSYQNGTYLFDAGTKTALWVRAQMDVSRGKDIAGRQVSSIPASTHPTSSTL